LKNEWQHLEMLFEDRFLTTYRNSFLNKYSIAYLFKKKECRSIRKEKEFDLSIIFRYVLFGEKL